MIMPMRVFLYFYLSILSILGVICQDEKPTFRIMAPQFICGPLKQDGNGTNSPPPTPPGITKIRLQTSPGQQLNYNWSVRFNVLNGPRGQRFNLMVWRAVRNLEKVLTADSDLIAETNMVAINNSMLIEGVNYVFNITGVNQRGIVGDTKSFALKFTDAKTDPKLNLDGNEDEQVSAVILGSTFTYANIGYMVEAHATPCNPTNDYYFSWKVSKMDDNTIVNINRQRGRKLIISPGILIGGKEYDIRCTIYKISTEKQLASNGIFIKVLVKGMSIQMNFDKLTMATNVPIVVSAFFSNPDNVQGTVNYVWSCKILPNLEPCDDFKSVNESNIIIEKGFQKEATYVFEITIAKGKQNISSSATLIIRNAMLPNILIGRTPVLNVAGESLELQTRVLDLRSSCNLRWASVEENGFALLDRKSVPGEMGNALSINSIEETFLSEIVEFGNETAQRSFPLFLPSANQDWNGLEPDVKYKFRLTVECACSSNIECFGPKNVTAFSDVIVETNGPPMLKEINVTPLSGIALKTKFQISTKGADDLRKDYPLTYTFGFKTESGDVTILSTLFESLSLETILPFSLAPLIPTLMVCDARSGCSSATGPSITVLKNMAISTDEIQFYLEKFDKELYRKEYRNGFNGISMILTTLKLQNDLSNYGMVMNQVEALIKNNVGKQIEEVKNNTFITSANEFIQESIKFIERFKTSDSLLQIVLQLRDDLFKIISKTSERLKCGRSFTRSPIKIRSMKRKMKRQIKTFRIKRDITADNLESYVRISEHVIVTSDSKEQIMKEKANVLRMLKKSAGDLCKDKQNIILEWKLLSFSVENMDAEIFPIPYSPHPGRKIKENMIAEGQFLAEFRSGTSYCIAKTFFAKSFLDDDDERRIGWIYHSSVYNDDQYSVDNIPIILKIPMVDFVVKPNEKLQCARWNINKWDKEACETVENILAKNDNGINYFVCKCENLGFFSLYTVENVELTTIKMTTVSNEITNELSSTVPTTITDYTTVISLCDDKDCTTTKINEEYINGKSSDKTSAFKLIFIIGFALIFVIVSLLAAYKVIKNKTKKRQISASIIRDGPKFKKIPDEYLLEGSIESLVKYNIINK